jgi:hypothetical protein
VKIIIKIDMRVRSVHSEISCNLPKMSVARSCNNLNDISLQYGEDRISHLLSSFLYTITVLVLIAVLSTTDSNALSPSPTMSQIALAADVTITKIQLPGIIPIAILLPIPLILPTPLVTIIILPLLR